MISQGIVIQDEKVLMVRQYVKRGDIVWNFPGGGIERNESPQQACIRELKEETGLDVQIIKLLAQIHHKFTFLVKVIGGRLNLDTDQEYNEEIVELAWIHLNDGEKFDKITDPIRQMLIQELPS